MERINARLSICLESLGKYSLIVIPGTEVSIALRPPPLSWAGFGSKVSNWLGPPVIHNRMHARLRSRRFAVWSASAGSQGDMEPPTTPAADRRSQSRLVIVAKRDCNLD